MVVPHHSLIHSGNKYALSWGVWPTSGSSASCPTSSPTKLITPGVWTHVAVQILYLLQIASWAYNVLFSTQMRTTWNSVQFYVDGATEDALTCNSISAGTVGKRHLSVRSSICSQYFLLVTGYKVKKAVLGALDNGSTQSTFFYGNLDGFVVSNSQICMYFNSLVLPT